MAGKETAMQPLAQDYVVVAESPDKERHFCRLAGDHPPARR